MAWARMDDGFHDHPKVDGLSLAAVGLWTLCFTWCNRHLGSDRLPPGFVPQSRVKKLRGERYVTELVDAGLWETAEGGWIFHDFEDYLPASKAPATSSEVAAARSEAGRRGAQARWHSDSKLPETDDGKLLSDPDGKPMPPSRPVPSNESSDEDSFESTRPELLALCEHLADRIEANGSRRPRIGKRWIEAARLLVDVDHRTPEQITTAIDWCQDDPFWRGNVLSMAKLREKYDQLRLAAQRTASPSGSRASTTDQRVADALALRDELRAGSAPAIGA